jgi:transcriptional adapter 2-alpha
MLIFTVLNEPGILLECDVCACDLTHSVYIKCADPICQSADDSVDLCPKCFCEGKEFKKHKRNHPYRVIVSRVLVLLGARDLISYNRN